MHRCYKRILGIIACCHLYLLVGAVTFSIYSDSFNLVQEIKGLKAVSIHSTKTDQLIVLTSDNEILKLDTTGKILFKYTNNYMGTPQFIYTDNLLHIVLFYPAYQTLLILDQWMNELRRINLSEFSIPFVSTIGVGPDMSIWYYDDQVKRIKKLDMVGKKIVETPIFTTDDNADWRAILIKKSYLIFQANSGNTYTLNVFGKALGRHEIRGEIVQLTNDRIYTVDREKRQLISFTVPSLFLDESIELSQNFIQSQSILIYPSRILEITEGVLRIWSRSRY